MIPSPLHPHPQLAPGEREASPAAQRRRFDDGPQSMEHALQLERPTSALAQPLDGRPAALILFSGPPTAAGGPSTLERELEAAGFRVVAFDKLAGGQAHDLSLADLQSEIRRRVRSGEFAFIFAGTPCSPYSIARGGAECPPLHTANGPVTPCPPGWEAHRAMHDGFIEFTCDVFRDGAAVAALCILENPADVSAPGPAHWAAKAHHGSIFKTAAVRKLCDDMHLLTLDFAQCAFASAYRKWTTFLFSAELYDLIAGWRHFGCTHGFGKHPDVAYGRDELGAAKSARAAAYPEALNQAIAALAAAFLARRTPPDGPPGVGRAADGPRLSPAIRAACEAAAAHPPRFSSLRNLRPASDDELRAEPIPELRPPNPSVPRREEPLANPWPPGWEARRPIAIEQLYRPGVYAALELWLEDGEVELLDAAIAADLPPDRLLWQTACRRRRAEWGERPARRSPTRGRTYTIPVSDMADGAEQCTWDTANRDDCVPVTPSHRDTAFPGAKQMQRERIRHMADALGWADLDLLDQVGEGGLEARTGCPRDTVVSRHHPGLYANFSAAAASVATDFAEQWARPPPPRQGGRTGHLPFVPCHADPRDVIMRLLTRAVEATDGSTALEDYFKARVSSNLSSGGARAVNAGVATHDKAVGLPTVPEIGRAAAVCDVAYVDAARPRRPLASPPAEATAADSSPEPRAAAARPPTERATARSGFYALDLASAYRYVCLQLLDLWCHCFMWLDADGHIGICVDTRLCFGGAYGPNRFERITTLIGAYILHAQDEYDRRHPYPAPVPAWAADRAARQSSGTLPPGHRQLTPKSLLVYLDDYSGSGGLDQSPDPEGHELLVPDVAAMRALGLEPAPAGSRIIALASIAAGELIHAGFGVATAKTMIGASVIALGLQPDVASDSITCPASKRRLLLAQLRDTVKKIADTATLERKPIERLTGRLCNISQILPEIGAELHGGYRVANARARGSARNLLTNVPLPPASTARRGLLRLCAVATDALEANSGIALAPARRFAAVGSSGVLTVTGDASGDIDKGDAGVGGFAFHPDQPSLIYITSELWPPYVARALRESALEPHLRSGAPRMSMPAAELFTSWALAEAAFDAGAPRHATSAVVAVGDCQPAAGALNRASSPVGLIRSILAHARASIQQWLGVQVPRELNLDADVLSHPSRVLEVVDSIPASLTVVRAPVPAHCWLALEAAIASADPTDSDF